MNREKIMKRHQTHFIIKVALHVATLATLICAVHELDRIHHRLKKLRNARKSAASSCLNNQ